MNKILITGNLGYVGSLLTLSLKNKNKFHIKGCDLDLFSKDYDKKIRKKVLNSVNKQLFKDIKNLNKKDLKNVNTVIHLAAISNDPIGNEFKNETKKTNFLSTEKLIKLSKKCGVKHFIFASSCSVYGFKKKTCTEKSSLEPLTPYSKSKVFTEKVLKKLSDKNFKVTIFRYATACGYSPFVRLDLVLNDFIASALFEKKIKILSSGDAERPLVSVKKMSDTIIWFLDNFNYARENYLVFNVGSNKMNFKIKTLAKKIKSKFKNIRIEINKKNIDNRSYKVDFTKFEKYTKNEIKEDNFNKIFSDTKKRISKLKNIGSNFRLSLYIRLNKVRKLKNL